MTTTATTTTSRTRRNRSPINLMFATNSLLLLTVIGGLLIANNQVSAYSPHAGVSIAARPSTYHRSSRSSISRSRILSTSFSTSTQLERRGSTINNAIARGILPSSIRSSSRSSSSRSSSTSLYHMGHSHSHHDHHDDSATGEPKVFNKQKMLRRLALVLFCWVATCGTKLIQTATNVNGARRFVGLSQNDWISFVVTSVALMSANKITKAIQQSVDNFRQFADGIRKHSSTSRHQQETAAAMDAQDDEQQQYQQQYEYDQHPQTLAADKADADRVTWIGVVVNLLLSVGKLGVGITAHSSALVADAGHSLSDLVSDFITLWSVNVARLPPDEDHPYGHYKFEAIGSLFLSLTLLATGASVGFMAKKQLMEVLHATSSSAIAGGGAAVQLPGPLALVMAGLSIFSKEWLFRITKKVGERLRSPVVIANAWHHRSDAYSSVLALLSIAWAMVGFPAADAAAGILVAGMICMTGGEILVESVKQLSDSADSGLQTEIVEILNELDDDDVIATTSVRARQMGSAASVEVTVEIPSVLSTTATRAVEERVRQRLLGELARRRGGGRKGSDSSTSGVIATVHAKPYLEISPTLIMEDYHEQHQISSSDNNNDEYDETTFAKIAFKKFDTDVDGKLSIEELKSGLEKTLKIQLSNEHVKKLIDEFDVNKDGYLELEEMVTIDKFISKIEVFSREEKELAIRQQKQQQQQQQQPNNYNYQLDDMPSTTYIEQQVRNQAQLMYPKIRSVEGVTVHYTSQNSVTVDVNIRITEDSGHNALRKVREYAQELKGNLETELQEIESARVYLDLNMDGDVNVNVNDNDNVDEIASSKPTFNATTTVSSSLSP